MKYRLTTYHDQYYLTLDSDLTQTPLFLCDPTFDDQRAGKLYKRDEVYFYEVMGDNVARLKFNT